MSRKLRYGLKDGKPYEIDTVERGLSCNFKDILERDMDMLLLEEFVCSKSFRKLFLSQVNKEKAAVVSVEHSKMDNELGESDLTIIFEQDSKKFALLIEDKIDAIAQQEQATRYISRGEKGVACCEYDEFYVFIVAPKAYLEVNEEAKKYPYSVSYEEVLNYFKTNQDARSMFKACQIQQAIYKKETGYQPIVHVGVSDFWENYIAYQQVAYPNLELVSSAGEKGANALWPEFRTQIKKLYILHKSNRGYIDLTFQGAKERIVDIDNLVKKTFGGYEEIDCSIVITGKSVALRMMAPIVDFKLPFDEEKEKVETCFQIISRMMSVSNKLDTVCVMNILGNI